MADLSIAILFILGISAAGFKLKSLTLGGAAAAACTGVSIYAGFGYPGLILLGVFFGSSSLWSKYKRNQKASVEEMLFKGDQRDAVQVFANGGAASLLSILYAFFPFEGGFAVYSAAIAAANADTWASEIGTLSRKKPRMIFSFKQVEKGTSGAVSVLGTAAAAAGSGLIALCAYAVFALEPKEFYLIFLIGFAGNLLDTFLGAAVQVQFQCPSCGKVTEKKMHCGTEGVKTGGFLDNDAVNFTAILGAAVLVFLFY
ncbi:DUF92 domain-containing protein [Bacillus sp. FSL H8-0547]